MVKGKDQTYARDSNVKAVFRLLSENDLSCSELAEITGLSKPAITNITLEMFRLNLIKAGVKTDGGKLALGRKRTYLTINPDFGMVAAVDFSTVVITIRLCDMVGNTIEQRQLADSEFISEEILENITTLLREMLALPSVEGKELLSLCIAASGMVDSRNNRIVVSPKFQACKDINLCEYFSQRFSCRVELKNDMNLALLSECRRGKLKGVSNAAMLYVDSGIGGALLIDDKVREGERGFAGEFGLITVRKGRKKLPIDAVCSINAIKDSIRERGIPDCLSENFHFADVVTAYYNGDKTVVSAVEESAEVLSEVIGNLFVGLDCRKIIISGRVIRLGETYLNKLRVGLRRQDYCVEFSGLNGNGPIMGAIFEAVNIALDVVIARRLNTRNR